MAAIEAAMHVMNLYCALREHSIQRPHDTSNHIRTERYSPHSIKQRAIPNSWRFPSRSVRTAVNTHLLSSLLLFHLISNIAEIKAWAQFTHHLLFIEADTIVVDIDAMMLNTITRQMRTSSWQLASNDKVGINNISSHLQHHMLGMLTHVHARCITVQSFTVLIQSTMKPQSTTAGITMKIMNYITLLFYPIAPTTYCNGIEILKSTSNAL